MLLRVLVVHLLLIGCCVGQDSSFDINLSADDESTITKTAPTVNTGFGYSLSFHNFQNANWLIVSAPYSEANPEVKINYVSEFSNPQRTGSAYSCPLFGTAKECQNLNYDMEINRKAGAVKANASSMLLGHTVVSASTGAAGFRLTGSTASKPRHSVACAPGLKIEAVFNNVSENYPIGTCFLWDGRFQPKELKTKLYDSNLNDFRNMFGFSSAGYGHSDADIFVFGIPGFNTTYKKESDYKVKEQGGFVVDVVSQNKTFETRVKGFSESEFEGYAGFAVAMSDIYAEGLANTITIITSAPRAANLTGRIYFVNFDIYTHQETRLPEKTLSSDKAVPVGSQFGFSLLPADINGDGFVDLLVSAPYAFDRTKRRVGNDGLPSSTGAVIVYLNLPSTDGSRSLSVTSPGILVPPSCSPDFRSCFDLSDGLFGLSMATPGDIDGDGILDVTIGAPGENHGKGAVYIYRGTNKGLVFAARLEPKDSTIKYFGFSLAGGNIDIDGNGYPDLGVGSFKSNRAWILRSRPVIRIAAQFTNKDGQRFLSVDPNSRTTFELCFEMNSPVALLQADATLNISMVLDLDTGRQSKRLTFSDKTSRKRITIQLRTDGRNPWQVKKCESIMEVYVAAAVVDPLTAANVTLTIENRIGVQPREALLMKIPSDGSSELKALEPWVHPDDVTQTWQIEFDRNCGADYICNTDLSLSAEFSKALEEGITKHDYGYDYDRGTTTAQDLTIKVNVGNKGEAAYNAKIYIAHSVGFSYKSSPTANVKCEHQRKLLTAVASRTTTPLGKPEELVVICSLPSPFPPPDWAGSMELIFGVSDAPSLSEHFTISINSSSQEKNSTDNSIRLDLNVFTTTILTISAASQPEQLNFSSSIKVVAAGSAKYFDEIGPNVKHVFIVENGGSVAVRRLNLLIAWPAEVDCQKDKCDHLLYLSETAAVGGSGGSCEDAKFVNIAGLMARPETLLKKPKERKRRAAVIMDPLDKVCVSNPDLKELQNKVRCRVSLCRLNTIKAGQRTKITLNFRVWQSTFLNKDFDAMSLFSLSSLSRLEYDANLKPRDDSVLENRISTEVYRITTAAEAMVLPAWAIAVLSVAGALLIVLLLLLILYFCGFFKRKQRPPSMTAQVEQPKTYPYSPVPQDIQESSGL